MLPFARAADCPRSLQNIALFDNRISPCCQPLYAVVRDMLAFAGWPLSMWIRLAQDERSLVNLTAIKSKYFAPPVFSMLPSGPRRFAGERGDKPSVQAFGGTVEMVAIPGMSIHFTVYGRENDQAEVEFGCSMPGTSNRGRGKQIMTVPSDMRPEFKSWIEAHAAEWPEYNRAADAAVNVLYQTAPVVTADQPVIPTIRLVRKRPDGVVETVSTAPVGVLAAAETPASEPVAPVVATASEPDKRARR